MGEQKAHGSEREASRSEEGLDWFATALFAGGASDRQESKLPI